ncbi:ATP-binding protein [Streptosporangium lutulentum]
MTAPALPPLAADLDGGLRRLKLSTIRALAPELLLTARTQRWNPEEFLRTLIDAELAARDASNARMRMKAAAFPVIKTIEEFDVAASSIPRATFDYLASLEWVRAAENYCAVGYGAPASPTASSRSASPLSRPVTRSVISPPPSWSRRSIGVWPTTPSAA